ncbi:MAG TPA: radical SAM protein [Candidatus Brocadiia bacterium]|nr:radical SAM protein [Candidatus Brocadiia bacterium]
MKILFIKRNIAFWEPLGIMYLSGALRKGGHETGFLFSTRKDFLDRVREFRPDVLAYSVTTGSHAYYLSLNREIKRQLPELRMISVMGGPHPTYFPEIVEEDGMDAVCMGEGEEAFVEFCDRLRDGRDPAATLNFWVKTAKGVVRNELRPLNHELDALPFPDRETVYAGAPHLAQDSHKSFFPNRGCPYSCTYCFNHALKKMYSGRGPWLRTHSVDYMIRQIREVKERYPLELCAFSSDIFTLDPEWVQEFRDKFPREIGLPFWVNIRANHVDDRIARLLAEAGCRAAYIGVESGVERIRNGILKRSMKRETILTACRALRENGIRIATQAIIGLPGETFDDALETCRMSSECRADFGWSSLFQPYPRTELWKYARDNGFFEDGADIPQTFYAVSKLKFRDRREKLMIENLHKLFALGVEYPGLLRVMPLLCSLPIESLYKLLYQFAYGYALQWRIFRQPYGPAEFLKVSLTRYLTKEVH